MTSKFYNYFTSSDRRRLFWEEGQKVEIDDISDFTNGIAFFKFKNITSSGAPGKANGFVDTDFPVFRYADALLMKAECAKRGPMFLMPLRHGTKCVNAPVSLLRHQ